MRETLNRRKLMNRIGYFIPVITFAVLSVAFLFALSRGDDPSLLPSTLIDKPVPVFDLAAIEGLDKGFSSEDLKGHVSLVNIFGSWCVACMYEHPILMKLARKKEVPIYGIDWKDKPGDGIKWLNRHGNPYTLIGDDAAGRVSIDFGVTGAPETFVVDMKGNIRYKHIGPITEESWKKTLKPLIEELRQQCDAC